MIDLEPEDLELLTKIGDILEKYKSMGILLPTALYLIFEQYEKLVNADVDKGALTIEEGKKKKGRGRRLTMMVASTYLLTEVETVAAETALLAIISACAVSWDLTAPDGDGPTVLGLNFFGFPLG